MEYKQFTTLTLYDPNYEDVE